MPAILYLHYFYVDTVSGCTEGGLTAFLPSATPVAVGRRENTLPEREIKQSLRKDRKGISKLLRKDRREILLKVLRKDKKENVIKVTQKR